MASRGKPAPVIGIGFRCIWVGGEEKWLLSLNTGQEIIVPVNQIEGFLQHVEEMMVMQHKFIGIGSYGEPTLRPQAPGDAQLPEPKPAFLFFPQKEMRRADDTFCYICSGIYT